MFGCDCRLFYTFEGADMQIFGDTEFSVEVIRCWVEENIADRVKVVIGEK